MILNLFAGPGGVNAVPPLLAAAILRPLLTSCYRGGGGVIALPRMCGCGCGEPTELAPKTSRRDGWIKGQPLRYRHGHNRRRYLPANVGPDVRSCRRCPYPLTPGRQNAPKGWRQHYGRGLCENCWRAARNAGELDNFERACRGAA